MYVAYSRPTVTVETDKIYVKPINNVSVLLGYRPTATAYGYAKKDRPFLAYLFLAYPLSLKRKGLANRPKLNIIIVRRE